MLNSSLNDIALVQRSFECWIAIAPFGIIVLSFSCTMALQSDLVVDASKFRPEGASEEVKNTNEILMDTMKSNPKWFQVSQAGRTLRP